ncbi:MAG: hypothetical protein ABWY80_07295 [Acidimicrobiia bacterium]
MREPTIALVFSPEPWVERLHRHLADHGGARVRQIVLDPAIALQDDYEILVVSHRWPGLTSAFVAALHARGRAVLGVFDPDEPAGHAHLLALGVDAAVSADAPVSDTVDALHGVEMPSAVASVADRQDSSDGISALPARSQESRARRGAIAIGGLAGAGASEVALAFAVASSSRRRTLLIDAAEEAPSLAPRLGLGLEPSLRSAVDAVVHDLGPLEGALVPVTARLQVIPGFPSTAGASQVLAHEMVHVVGAVTASDRVVVIDVGRASGDIAVAVVREAETLLFVLSGTPIGVSRALTWVAQSRELLADVNVHLVVNRAPRDRFKRAELAHELTRTFNPTAVWWLPADRRVDDAMWRAEPVRRGAFADAVACLADSVTPSTAARPPRATRGATRRSTRRSGRAA